jgi:hypothetical protein
VNRRLTTFSSARVTAAEKRARNAAALHSFRPIAPQSARLQPFKQVAPAALRLQERGRIMTLAEQRDPKLDNPVSGFEVGIITLRGTKIGVCIKFSMYDGSERLTHWTMGAYEHLMLALRTYHDHLGESAFFYRAAKDKSLVEGLSPRHPYHTILSDLPTLSEEEIGSAGLQTGIGDADFVSRGPTFEMRPRYGDGRSKSIFVHEYTALSLYGYLQEYMEAAERLAGPAAGTA